MITGDLTDALEVNCTKGLKIEEVEVFFPIWINKKEEDITIRNQYQMKIWIKTSMIKKQSFMSQIDLNWIFDNTTYNLLYKHTRLRASNSWSKFQQWLQAKKRKNVTLHLEFKKYQMYPIQGKFKD